MIGGCLNGANPIYTIQSLRSLLERMGEWEGFTERLSSNTSSDAMFEAKQDVLLWVKLATLKNANILTSDELMAKAVLKYFKGAIG